MGEEDWLNSSRLPDASARKFEIDELPSCLILPETVQRISTCELEIDAVAADVLNSNKSLLSLSSVGSSFSERLLEDLEEVQTRKKIMNPGLEAIWQDERSRRQRLNLEEDLTPPSSPKRGPER